MLTKEDLRNLLEIKSENKNLDYKEKLNWSSCHKDERKKIVKDILAMSNIRDGGKIIFGVKDSNYEMIGLSEEDYESFDTTKVNNLLQKYTEPKHSCEVYKHEIQGMRFVIINVPQFMDTPILCKEDARSTKDKSKIILKKSGIYIRTEKASSELIQSEKEMRELLGLAMVKRGDWLLSQIAGLLEGRPIITDDKSEEKYRKEIEEAEVFFQEKMGGEMQQNGYWEIYAYPTIYRENRFKDHSLIDSCIRGSQVRIRGWDVPHIDEYPNLANFPKGQQSFTKFTYSIEGYRAYFSGLFVFLRIFEEDVIKFRTDQGVRSFVYISNIWFITEIMLFLKRYFSSFDEDEFDLVLCFKLNGTRGREMNDYDRGIMLRQGRISIEDNIQKKSNFKLVDLKSKYKFIANEIARYIFSIFNINDITENEIESIQEEKFRGIS